MLSGKIFDIKKYVIHDGPGIRTTVFFKGCPLSCRWCHDESNGGITISGGEPLMQPTFLMELLEACGKLDLHRTVDTSGHADTQILLQTATRTNLFLYDLKHMDPEKHAEFTGVSNEKILTNLKILNRQGAEIVIRFPIIPGFNSEPENVDQTGAFVASLPGVNRLHILPYHCAAVAKYNNLGLKYYTLKVAKPSLDYLASIAARLENYNLDVKIGG